jgi:hypothetical protein
MRQAAMLKAATPRRVQAATEMVTATTTPLRMSPPTIPRSASDTNCSELDKDLPMFDQFREVCGGARG